MDTADKFKLLNMMGRCEVKPAIPPREEQKYCVVFRIWIGTTWMGSGWEYGPTVDATIDKMWESIKEELWTFVTQIEAGH